MEPNNTREQVLTAALKEFANRGYAGASVQDIVDAAKVTKPTLYYYFENKAALYQALIDSAHDTRYHLMQKGMANAAGFEDKVVAALSALFEFLKGNRELMRLAFLSAFASPGEVPPGLNYIAKCERNFAMIEDLVAEGKVEGLLDDTFTTRELAMSLYGMLTIHVMAFLLNQLTELNRQTAERIVQLFLQGAGKEKTAHNREALESA